MKNKIEQIRDLIKKAKEKAKIIGGTRADKLYAASERLGNYLCEMECPDSRWSLIRDHEDHCKRICFNNERKGISLEISRGVLGNESINMFKLLEATSRFAKNGDPLAQKIMDYSGNLTGLTNFSDEAMYRLINRQLNEQDYYDYLEGNLPIVTLHSGEGIYLSNRHKNLNPYRRERVNCDELLQLRGELSK